MATTETTNEEIRQKAIECGEAFSAMCHSNDYETDYGFITICHCPYNEVADVTDCAAVYGYEHGFADGVQQGRRRVYEEYMKAVKADEEASMHGDMFSDNVARFRQEIRVEHEN